MRKIKRRKFRGIFFSKHKHYKFETYFRTNEKNIQFYLNLKLGMKIVALAIASNKIIII